MKDSTSPTLLEQLRDVDNQEAWKRFFDLYAPLIVGFARQRGCSLELARDVLQETMVCLMKSLPDFRYDPARGRFRSFLFHIVNARIVDAWRRNKRYSLILDAPISEQNDAPRAQNVPANGADSPDQEWDDMWRMNMLGTALERVRRRVTPRTYESFRLYVLEQNSASQVAEMLGISPNTVYQHRNRIVRMLRMELEKLQKLLGES